MKRIATTLIITGLLAHGAATWAADDLPAPSRYRIILHGVDCSLDGRQTCPEDRPVLNEAVALLNDGAPVVARTDVANRSGEEETLSPAALDAVCEYLLTGGIAPDRITIGDSPVRAAVPPTEIQLSRSEQ